MRKFALIAAAIIAAFTTVAYVAIEGLEREIQRQHLVRVCEPGENKTGRKAGLFYGAWTHRVPGLGRSASKAEKIKTCKFFGFNPEN